MPATLDWNKPYADVHGADPIRHLQDGKCFLGNGEEYIDPDSVLPELPAHLAHLAPGLPDWASVLKLPESVAQDAANQRERERRMGPDDLRLKENQILKVAVETAGGEWTTAAAAREFLAGKKGSTG